MAAVVAVAGDNQVRCTLVCDGFSALNRYIGAYIQIVKRRDRVPKDVHVGRAH